MLLPKDDVPAWTIVSLPPLLTIEESTIDVSGVRLLLLVGEVLADFMALRPMVLLIWDGSGVD